MKQIIRSIILRKFLTLAFLIVGLVFAASTDFSTQKVNAGYECCEDCLPAFELCMEFCTDPQTTYPGCYSVCTNAYNNCRNYCSRCS
jgi:hypothetical protein